MIAVLSWRSSWFLILLSWIYFILSFVLNHIQLSLLLLVNAATCVQILKFRFTHHNIIIFLGRLNARHGYLRNLFRLSFPLVFFGSFLNLISFERVRVWFQLSLWHHTFLNVVVVLEVLLLLKYFKLFYFALSKVCWRVYLIIRTILLRIIIRWK